MNDDQILRQLRAIERRIPTSLTICAGAFWATIFAALTMVFAMWLLGAGLN